MHRKKFMKVVKKLGFNILRSNGKHLIIGRGIERFAVPRGGNNIKLPIIWRFQKEFNLKILIKY